MLVEVYLFLVMPVVKELHTSIAKLYELKKLPKRTIVSLTIAILAIIFLFIPWQSRIEIPAVIGYKNDSKIYVQHAGQIESVNIKTGAKVIKDQILVTLHSPEIDHQMAKVKNELEILETKLRQESGLGKKLGEKQVSVAELAEKKSEYNNLLAESTKLIIKAPHDGEITNISKSAKLDTWLKDEDYLLSLSDIKSKVIIGYIMEQDLNRLPQDISNLQGKIYFNKIVTKPYTIKVVRIDNARNKYLENPYFASTHGGDLLVFANNTKSNKRSSHGEEYILNDAVYRVLAEPLYPEDILPDYAVRGKMHIYGERSSIASRSIRYVLAVLLRESGF